MRRLKPKTLAFVLRCLPGLALIAFCFWVWPIVFRPFALTLNQVTYGDLFSMKGVWHYAEITYPRSITDLMIQNELTPISLKMICIDATGRQIEGFDLNRRYSEPGKSRGAIFYSFKYMNSQKLKGPLRFVVETDTEKKSWKRTFPPIKIELKDLPRKVGQSIAAK